MIKRMQYISGVHLEPQMPKGNNDNDNEGDVLHTHYLSGTILRTLYVLINLFLEASLKR